MNGLRPVTCLSDPQTTILQTAFQDPHLTRPTENSERPKDHAGFALQSWKLHACFFYMFPRSHLTSVPGGLRRKDSDYGRWEGHRQAAVSVRRSRVKRAAGRRKEKNSCGQQTCWAGKSGCSLLAQVTGLGGKGPEAWASCSLGVQNICRASCVTGLEERPGR